MYFYTASFNIHKWLSQNNSNYDSDKLYKKVMLMRWSKIINEKIIIKSVSTQSIVIKSNNNK